MPCVSSTIGASFSSYPMTIDDNKIKFNIWDTAGQERYRSLVHMYYRQVDFCIIIFDILNYNVKDIKYWIEEFLTKTNNPHPKFVLVANKIDLITDLECNDSISYDLKTIINKYDVKLFKTSALNGINVDELFEYIGQILISMPEHQRFNTFQNILESNLDTKNDDIWSCGCYN